MKTAVDSVFIGKDRQYNRRFVRMCGHYLVDPVACTPASGWEKGQVENQVRLVRERFFRPRVRVASYEELNGWLLDRCVAYTLVIGEPPAEADLQPFLQVTPPSVHQMVITLERNGLIRSPPRHSPKHRGAVPASRDRNVSRRGHPTL